MTMVLKSEYGMRQDAYKWSKTAHLAWAVMFGS